MQSMLRTMNTFSNVSFADYFVCVSLKEQIGYATQADYLLSNHNCHAVGMTMTYKHTNTLVRQND